MDINERLFGEIAVQLQVLTREQWAACMQARASDESGRRVAQIAVELGFATHDEIALVAAQQRKLIERRRTARKQRPGAAVEERQHERQDPRSSDAIAVPSALRAGARSAASSSASFEAPSAQRPATTPARVQPPTTAAPRGAGAAHGGTVAGWANQSPPASTSAQSGGWHNAPAAPPAGATLEAGFGTAEDAPRAGFELADGAMGGVAQAGSAADMGFELAGPDESGFELAEPAPGQAFTADPANDGDSAMGPGWRSGSGSHPPDRPEQPLAQGPEHGSAHTMFGLGQVAPLDPEHHAEHAGDAGRRGSSQWTNTPITASTRMGTMIGTGSMEEGLARVAAAEEAALRAAAQAEQAAVRALRAPSGRPPPKAAPLPRASVPPVDEDVVLKAPRLRPQSSGSGERYLDKLLKLGVQHKASDLHVHSNAQVMARIHGKLRPMSAGQVMNPQAAEKVLAEVMTDAQWERLARTGQVDFAYEIPGTGRFRVNAYKQQSGLDIVFRIIPPRPPTLEELGLPDRLGKLMDYRTGMVLCTGPAGCGKSSTLAALVSMIAQRRRDHILTVEDPVEFVHPASVALVNQRQVITHTQTYASALKAALREDPDVIVIAELRDMETISLAMSAAETGHLVLGTLHTGNAAQTINRISSVFPADEQEQARVMLAESLRAVLSQRLVPRADGQGRVPAFELLMVSTAVSNIIRDNKTYQLPSVMQTGKAAGMVTLDDSLEQLLRAGTITREEAVRFAVKKERFSAKGAAAES